MLKYAHEQVSLPSIFHPLIFKYLTLWSRVMNTNTLCCVSYLLAYAKDFYDDHPLLKNISSFSILAAAAGEEGIIHTRN